MKLCFVLPEYHLHQANHYPYLIEMVDDLGKNHETFVYFEKSTSPPHLKHTHHVYSQKITQKPFNLLERFVVFLILRVMGYRKFYIHYSYWSLFICKLLSYPLPLTTYYWNCERYLQKPSDRLLNLALKTSDILLTGSQDIAWSYKKTFNLDKEIRIVPNWVKPVVGNVLTFPPNRTHILFVHRLSPRKGSREIPSIIDLTLKKKPQVHFHIIGDGPDLNWLTARLKKYRTHSTLYGSLPLSETASFFQAADLFIMPSRREGFPRVILEAGIYKIPFVSTNVGNVAELSGKLQQQFIVPRDNAQIFARKIIELINYPDKKTLIEQNYQLASRYTLDYAAAALEKALI